MARRANYHNQHAVFLAGRHKTARQTHNFYEPTLGDVAKPRIPESHGSMTSSLSGP